MGWDVATKNTHNASVWGSFEETHKQRQPIPPLVFLPPQIWSDHQLTGISDTEIREEDKGKKDGRFHDTLLAPSAPHQTNPSGWSMQPASALERELLPRVGVLVLLGAVGLGGATVVAGLARDLVCVKKKNENHELG